ncbi:MAG: energy transducer TonB, partial [Bacteroidetes bacterium]|nr:energy transducer TonB [Bacteroidota bacterium]
MKTFLIALICSIPLLVNGQGNFDMMREAENVGGKSELNRFLKQEMIYPDSSLKALTGGKVTWAFLVGVDGVLSHFKLITAPNNELANEALRLIKMLQWRPADVNGKVVLTEKDLTIYFNAKKHPKICKKRGYNIVSYPYQPYDTTFAVYDKVDKAPKLNMQGDNFSEFLTKNIRYPSHAYKNEIKGTVEITFIIEPSGM